MAGRLVTSVLTSAKECFRRGNGGEAEDRKRSRKHSMYDRALLRESEAIMCGVLVSRCHSTGNAWPSFEKRAVSASQCLIR